MITHGLSLLFTGQQANPYLQRDEIVEKKDVNQQVSPCHGLVPPKIQSSLVWTWQRHCQTTAYEIFLGRSSIKPPLRSKPTDEKELPAVDIDLLMLLLAFLANQQPLLLWYFLPPIFHIRYTVGLGLSIYSNYSCQIMQDMLILILHFFFTQPSFFLFQDYYTQIKCLCIHRGCAH